MFLRKAILHGNNAAGVSIETGGCIGIGVDGSLSSRREPERKKMSHEWTQLGDPARRKKLFTSD